MHALKTIVTALAAAAVSFAATAQELTPIKVGMLPSVNSAPIILGIEKGFFKEEGLDVKPQFMGGGSELTVALVSGATQISHIGVVNAIIAKSKGLPIKILTAYLKESNKAEDAFTQIVVRQDSGIKTLADLAGKTVAVNEVRAYGETVVKAALEKQNLKPDSIKLVEVPFPDMAAALDNKHVDAVWILEPFLTRVRDAGNVAIAAPAVIIAGDKNFLDGALMSSEPYIAKNPKVIDAFTKAMNRSTKYAAEHIDEVRAIIPTYTRVNADFAKRVKLPAFDATIDPAMIEMISGYLAKYGIIARPVKATDLVRSGS